MANKEHLEILEKGMNAWNEWRGLNPNVRPDLAGVSFYRLAFLALYNARPRKTRRRPPSDRAEARERMVLVDLSGANFSRTALDEADLTNVKLVRANFQESTLSGAQLERSILREADLFDAHLRGANLGGADLVGANLTEASLVEADLRDADLTGADLTRAQMLRTVLGNNDLRLTKGLATVRHPGPSTMGIDVIYRSGGEIPESFLRGVGVPEGFIVYMRSLVSSAIEYYSCFISYSSKDEEFAKRLYADLQSAGVRCWFAPEDLKIGDRIRPEIDEAIRVHDKLLLVLTESSVKSAWVEKEVETAFEKERKQGRTVLFPIRLDDAVMETDEAWAADIRRTRHIGDSRQQGLLGPCRDANGAFREWKNHDKYKEGFARLMRDLKA